MQSPETRVRHIAERQHGTFTRRQALSAGLSEEVLKRRTRLGVWSRLDHGTYLMFGEPGPRTYLAAAVFALPATVSHTSAAELHGLAGIAAHRPEVTVPHRLSNRFAAVDVHESTDLDPDYVVEREGLPTTNVARTIFDLAIRFKKGQLRRVVDDAVVRRLITPDDLSDIVASIGRRGRPGTASMRMLLRDLSVRYVAPESELERRLLELIEGQGFPEPVLQMNVPWRSSVDGRVDMAFQHEQVIVECDGRRWHTLAESFERDRRRDNLAQAAGWRVLRFTWDDVTQRPSQVVRQIRSLVVAAA